MKTRCLLVDDEPHALAVLRSHITAVPMLEVVAQCTNAIAAFEALQKHPVDLIFLDIKMPQLSGTDFLRALRNPPKVIFTTAYREYAFEGFELDVVDYLLKPISLERFLKAIQKAGIFHHADHPALPMLKEMILPENERFLYFRVDRKMVKVLLKDILYIESLKDYIKIVMPGKQFVVKQTITSLEEMLPEDQFLRIHRSFVVALDKIQAYSAHHVDVAGKELPIGRNHKTEIAKWLKME